MYAPPPPPPAKGTNTALVIVLVLAGVLALGGGGCLVCLGVGTYASMKASPPPSALPPQVTAPSPPPPVATPDTPPQHLPDLRPAAPSTVTPKSPARPVVPPPAAKGPRTVDFVCPAGQPPQGVVRAGCLCGSEILGTACGPGTGFLDVTPTARGCRFSCP